MLSVGRVQALTRELIRDVGITRPPVPVLTILAVTGAYVHIDPSMPETIDGALLVGPRCTLVCINGRRSQTRQRFSLAHECGHLYLHADAHRGGYLLSTHPNRSQEEREASRFASELLMPEEWMRTEWRRNRDREYLAHVFSVSRAALGVRLRELGLVVRVSVPLN